MLVKILGVSGSPYKGGNTDIMVQEALRAARETGDVETDFIGLAGKNIHPCLGHHCRFELPEGEVCRKPNRDELGWCVIKDDMQKFYPRLLEADAWIIGSPVYMATVTGQLKMFMDRTRPITGGPSQLYPGEGVKQHGWLMDKVGAAVSVGWARCGNELMTARTILDWLLCNTMIVVGIDQGDVKGYGWVGAMGVAGIADSEPKGILKDEPSMQLARNIGVRVANVTKMVKAGKKELGL